MRYFLVSSTAFIRSMDLRSPNRKRTSTASLRRDRNLPFSPPAACNCTKEALSSADSVAARTVFKEAAGSVRRDSNNMTAISFRAGTSKSSVLIFRFTDLKSFGSFNKTSIISRWAPADRPVPKSISRTAGFWTS